VELMKFGYQLERNADKFKNPATIFPQLAGGWNLLSNKYGNFRKKKSLKSGEFGAFFSTKILCMSCTGIYLFLVATSPGKKKKKKKKIIKKKN